MISLLQMVAGVAKQLTDGTQFMTNVKNQAEIVYHQYVMPPRPQSQAADVLPFCLVKAREFGLFPGRRQQIELIYCLYNDDRTAAMTDMATLTSLIEPLAVRGAPYAGWKLNEVKGFAGEPDTGVQPHPEYFLTVIMEFIGPPIKRSN